MQLAPIPKNEKKRLLSLHTLGLLDTMPEKRFDVITRAAVRIFRVPICTLTLIDARREWFKSCQGLKKYENARAISFCGHALLANKIFVIPDTKKDARFSDNPMVVNKPYIRFYAGVPIMSTDGERVGVFCIKDIEPREFSKNDMVMLKELAYWAEMEVNFHNLSSALRQEGEISLKLEGKVTKLIKFDELQKKSKKTLLNVMEDLEKTNSLLAIGKARDKAIFESIGDGMIITNNKRKITFFNKSAEEITGLKMSDVVDRHISEVIKMGDEKGNSISENQLPIRLALSTKKKITTLVNISSLYFNTKKVRRFPVTITVTPFLNKNEIVGAILIFRDITKEKETEKIKTEFIANATHELRTPLAIIKGNTDLALRRGKKDPKFTKNALLEINNEIKHLSNILSEMEILTLDNKENKLAIYNNRVNLNDLLRKIVRRLESIAQEKNMSIDFKKEQIDFFIFGNKEHLEKLFLNVIKNAINYGKNNGKISIKMLKEKDTIKTEITDNGIGISKEDLPKIFKRFFKSEKAHKYSSDKHSGLGLAISKRVTEEHGGNIEVKSIEGKGSTFTVSLPVLNEKILKDKKE